MVKINSEGQSAVADEAGPMGSQVDEPLIGSEARSPIQYKARVLHAWRPELTAEASQTFAGLEINETGIFISGKCDITQDFLKAKRTLRDHLAQ
jgi:hypothetical protein